MNTTVWMLKKREGGLFPKWFVYLFVFYDVLFFGCINKIKLITQNLPKAIIETLWAFVLFAFRYCTLYEMV